ncbi:MAG: OmpH family outer membrane protein [FCB group bacterium]|nr:OmpH family outer membrane protein [FCB group bacterium]
MSKIIKMVVLTVGLVALLGGTVAAQKFGFIDSEKIQQNYKEWAKAQEQFNTELKAWEDEAGMMERELRQLIDEYEKQRLILSADKKAEREAAIQAKDQALAAYTRDISGPGGRAEKRMSVLVKPLYEKIQAAIEKLAIEENYMFIFNSAGLAYAKQENDITEKVIEILESGE